MDLLQNLKKQPIISSTNQKHTDSIAQLIELGIVGELILPKNTTNLFLLENQATATYNQQFDI